MFKLIGACLLLYIAWSVWKGEVYARSGAWGKTVYRDESPVWFWIDIGIYTGLAIALVAVF